MNEPRNKTGKGGFKDNPGHINRTGRPPLGQAITPFLRSIGQQETIIKDRAGNEIKVTKAEALGYRIWQEALSGDHNFIKLIINYTDGMPIQQVKFGDDGEVNPIVEALNKITGDKKVDKNTDNNSND